MLNVFESNPLMVTEERKGKLSNNNASARVKNGYIMKKLDLI